MHCREEAGGQRYLLVGDEPCASTLSLPAVAQPLFPQYKLDLKTAYPSWLTAAFTVGFKIIHPHACSPIPTECAPVTLYHCWQVSERLCLHTYPSRR